MPRLSNTPDKPVRLIFPSANCKRRVITLGAIFVDGCYTQSEIRQMAGEFVRLTDDEANRLTNKVRDLESRFRSSRKRKGRNQVEGNQLSQREVVELAMNEVFAGVSVVQKKK
ncbi:hypothetical protein JXA59_00065 [Patescibacteria group bacterium]|nr:hypothetical protein [Patescibacteria group bacterium]